MKILMLIATVFAAGLSVAKSSDNTKFYGVDCVGRAHKGDVYKLEVTYVLDPLELEQGGPFTITQKGKTVLVDLEVRSAKGLYITSIARYFDGFKIYVTDDQTSYKFSKSKKGRLKKTEYIYINPAAADTFQPDHFDFVIGQAKGSFKHAKCEVSGPFEDL